ncbi:Cysteine-rich receptor-like protein kinase 2 [Apostasia shenzhenica]|uniref:non-specific serine/threonine protein kinase n=1 Tax=Apostasia shenzhenica TaxID=1088818 RepID=A0A2H9ZXT5_9ASPA|nr:Cysteine-rich receptor-like protein kinase 2 [Apostasia shenzhenica]
MLHPFSKTVVIPLAVLLCLSNLAAADPQTNLLNFGCSSYNATDPSVFLSNRNATISDLLSQISEASSGGSGGFSATAERSSSPEPVYALAFCRVYLSHGDCLTCLSTAAAHLRDCGAGTGGRAVYDGCEARYESGPFYDQGSQPGNAPVCVNGTSATSGFAASVLALMRDLSSATPRVSGYFAAAIGSGVYGVAQCSPTVTSSVCANCLLVAFGNIKQCFPSSDGRAVDAGCFLRYSEKAFFPANSSMDLAVYIQSGSKSKKVAIVGAAAAGACILLVLGLVLFLWIRWSRRPEEHWRGDILGATELRGPTNFHYADLKSATNNFSKENKLGEGGFGEVFKGTLKNGKIIAVKKLTMTQTKSARASFLSEVKLISNVHHQNLLRLLGCSGKRQELLLVYEYMANGSLDRFLFGGTGGMLTWKQRFDIIVGMARGLAYLHHEFHVCIIHRDIKSSNVLLDDNFKAKIADFGLARLRPGDQSHLSSYFAGTLYAWQLHEEGRLPKLIDKSMDPHDYKLDEVLRAITVALLCTQVAAARPTMSEVVVLLLSEGWPQLTLTKPAFIETQGRAGDEITSSPVSSSAANTSILMPKFSAR